MPANDRLRQSIQDDIVTASVASLRNGRDVFVAAPTGFGKTNIALGISRLLHLTSQIGPDGDHVPPPDGISLFVQDRISLSQQNAGRAASLGMQDIGTWTHGRHSQTGHPIFSTIDTALLAAENMPKISTLFIDEAHHAIDPAANAGKKTEHAELIDRLTASNPDMKIVALSATPERGDDKPLHPRLAASETHRVSTMQALETGAITPIRTVIGDWTTSDGTSAHTKFEDISRKTLGNGGRIEPAQFLDIMNHSRPDDFADQAVAAWGRHAKGRPTFAYTDRVDQADELATAFRSAGVPAAAISYKTSERERTKTLADYAAGKLTVLTSADMLIEGIDAPRTAVVLNTKSAVNHSTLMQIKGRPTRDNPNPLPKDKFDKTHAIFIEMGATPYITGTSESLIDLETTILHGSKKSNTRLWTGTRNKPPTYTLPFPGGAYFAVATSTTGGPKGDAQMFHIYTAKERRNGPKATRPTTIERLTTEPMLATDANNFARNIVADNRSWYARGLALASAEPTTQQARAGKEAENAPGPAARGVFAGIRHLDPPDLPPRQTMLKALAVTAWQKHGQKVMLIHDNTARTEEAIRREATPKPAPTKPIRRTEQLGD